MRKICAMTAAGLVAVALAAGAVPRPSAAGSAAAPAHGDEQNLVVNGSFEDGPEVDAAGYVPVDEDSIAIRGWVVTRGQIDLQQETGGKVKADHGTRSLDLHGSPGFGGVEQTFETTVGRQYRVTFRMSGNPGVWHERVQLAVRAAGKKEVFDCDMAGKSLDDLQWEKKTWEFTAVGPTTVLELHTAMAPSAHPFGGPLPDDVNVTAAD